MGIYKAQWFILPKDFLHIPNQWVGVPSQLSSRYPSRALIKRNFLFEMYTNGLHETHTRTHAHVHIRTFQAATDSFEEIDKGKILDSLGTSIIGIDMTW